jgi:hypothetical protein
MSYFSKGIFCTFSTNSQKRRQRKEKGLKKRLLKGLHQIKIVIDPENELEETNENNNEFIQTVQV